MTTDAGMHLTLSLAGHGFHPAAWRVSTLPDGRGLLPDYRGLVALAETATLDAILLPPTPFGPAALASGALEAVQPDPLPRLASLIAHSSRIGLGGAVYVGHTEPYHTARAFAVLDGFCAGRSALLADTQGADQHAADFAHAPRPAAEAYARAGEYLDVVAKLWESWDRDAVRNDKPAGIFVDGMKVHRIDHSGPFFRVRGPLTVIRAPQGRPVLVQWDASDAGLALAARTAEVFLARCAGLAEATSFAALLRARSQALGRPAAALRVLMDVMPILGPTVEAAEARAAALDAMAPPDPGGPLRVVGTPADLAGLMATWVRAGACDGFNILPAVLPDDAALLAEAVVPALRAQGLFRDAYAGQTLRDHLRLPQPPAILARSDAA